MLIKASVFFIGLLLSFSVFANEDEHGGGGGGHEAPPAAAEHGGGGGEEHGGGHEAAAAPKATLPPWVEVESRISALEAKVKTKENNITKLIEEKNHLDTKSPKMREVIEEISKEHKEMRKAAEDLEKEKTILRYRYPERSANPKRKYEKVEVKSVQEMEANMGLDGRLQRTLNRTRQQYGADPAKKEKAAHPEPAEKHEKPVTEEGAIILQK